MERTGDNSAAGSIITDRRKRILIVEDEAELCITLGDRLKSQGYDVECAFDGETGVDKIREVLFDLIILDIMLPVRSGLDLCADIRNSGFNVPILILTALSQPVDKVAALKLGADDYVAKPFDTIELMARIEALLRRASIGQVGAGRAVRGLYRFGAIELNVWRSSVTRNGNRVGLTSREFQLFRYLAERPGITVSRRELLEQVWGYKWTTSTRTVDMHIATLRQKLEPFPKSPQMIVTVPLKGYTFQI